MAKILLVEDDNNLREIYQARLMAEGYDIVTAQNGEEALVVAKQQKPDLIISDVMMPRISGFEMLDILRNTAELKHTKVIMLTALGQEDDQTRANSLGADKYLVKSQVTLEDIVTASKELLNGDSTAMSTPATAPAAATAPASSSMVAPAAPNVPAVSHIPDANPQAAAPGVAGAQAPAAAQPAPDPAAPADPAAMSTPATAPAVSPAVPAPPAAPEPTAVTPVAEPVAVQPEPVPSGPTTPAQPPAPAVIDKAAQGLEAEEAALQAQIASYSQSQSGDAANPPSGAAPSDSAQTGNDQALADAVKQLSTPDSAGPGTAPDIAAADANPAGRKVVQPISDPTAKPDLNALLAKEEAASSAGSSAAATPPSAAGGQTFDPNTSL